MADPVAAASQFSGDFPAWVLLEPFASLGECRNHTTATSLTSFNRPIELSFELVDPPKVSRWFVRLVGRKKQRGFYGKPFILNSSGSGSLVVLRMAFFRPDEGRILDYFVYKAGPGKPSLDLIPGPCPAVNFPKLIGILPSDDGGHYSVIFPVAKFRHDPRYKILVFSSVDQSWSTKFASICPDSKTVYRDAVMHHPSTAIAVGQGSLAWIDVWLGVLVCDRLDEDNPVLRLIPWPCNNPMDVYSPDASRGATLSDGTIRFVQAKFHYSFCCHSRDVIPIGWTATMWKRRRGLEEREWEMCFEVDIAKILTNHSSSSDLLQKVWDTESNKLDLNKVSSSVPILSLTNEDILYLKMNLLSNEALLIAVNVRKNKLEAVQQTSFEFVCSPCSFSSLFDASSGIDTSNQLDECNNRDNVECVETYLLAALDELKDIGGEGGRQREDIDTTEANGGGAALHGSVRQVDSSVEDKVVAADEHILSASSASEYGEIVGPEGIPVSSSELVNKTCLTDHGLQENGHTSSDIFALSEFEEIMQTEDANAKDMTTVHSIDCIEMKQAINTTANDTYAANVEEKKLIEGSTAGMNEVRQTDYVEEQTQASDTKELSAVQNIGNFEENKQTEDTDAKETNARFNANDVEHKTQTSKEITAAESTCLVEEKHQLNIMVGQDGSNNRLNKEIAPLNVPFARASMVNQVKKPSTKERVLSFRRWVTKDSNLPVKSGSPKFCYEDQQWSSPAKLPHMDVDRSSKEKKMGAQLNSGSVRVPLKVLLNESRLEEQVKKPSTKERVRLPHKDVDRSSEGNKQPWMPVICCHSVD